MSSHPREILLGVKAAQDAEAKRLRDQSLRSLLKRKRISQPAHKCNCGKTISGNKKQCAGCAAKV